MKTSNDLAKEFLDGKITAEEFLQEAISKRQRAERNINLLEQFAQALVDNENSQRCDFCATGYCYGSHEPDCVIEKAKEILKGSE